MWTHIFNVSAILSADNIKIQMSFFLILFFLPSLIWEREREYVIAILRKSGGRKQSLGSLSFSTGSFWEYFLFYGLAGFYTTWLEVFFLSKILQLFPGLSATVSTRLYHINCCPENPALLLCPDFGMRFARPFAVTCFLKTQFFIFYFRWRKECYFGF